MVQNGDKTIMLIGQYISSVSKSRRVAIPKEFRKTLGKKMIITKWYEKCLVLTSTEHWQTLFSRVSNSQNPLTSPVRDTDRFLLGSAYQVTTDSQGRTVIPETLVEYGKITNKALFLGLQDRVEIWDPKEWEKREQYISAHASGMIEEIVKLGQNA